jgi:hypothetical protein
VVERTSKQSQHVHAGTPKFNLPAAVASINFASIAANLYVAFSGLPGKRH